MNTFLHTEKAEAVRSAVQEMEDRLRVASEGEAEQLTYLKAELESSKAKLLVCIAMPRSVLHLINTNRHVEVIDIDSS